jgi:MFS family permease
MNERGGTLAPYRWELLAWLWLAFFFNQADRQVFGTVLPQLTAELGLSDIEAGMVASIFTAALAVMVPLAGYAGDNWSRKRLVAGSLLGWSAATLLTGFASGLVFLIVVRSVATGAGEAFYAPSANSLIGEHHVETRGRAMAIHQTSLYLGVVASGLLAGGIADRYGWRASFWIFGACGIALAALIAWRLQPDRERSAQAGTIPVRLVLSVVLRRPTVLLLALAFACMVFVNVGFLTWMPTHLHTRFGLSLAAAGFSSMFYHHAAAFLGVMLGGHVSDRLAVTASRRRLDLQASALLLGAPFIALLGAPSGPAVSYLALAGFGLFRGMYDSNIYASLFEVIEPRFRASAAALVIAFAFLAGAIAPVALGAAKQVFGLSVGLSLLAVVYLAGSGAVAIASWRFFAGDYRAVHAQAVTHGR